MKLKNWLVDSPEGMEKVAGDILANWPDERLFVLIGDLGAGKTTLVQAFARQLGVEEAATSPTYSIVNEYEGTAGTIFHFDFYRIKTPEEVLDIGFYEYVDSGAWCFMEWPEMIGSLVPEEALRIEIAHKGLNSREVSLVTAS